MKTRTISPDYPRSYWARGLHRNHGEWGSARYCRGWHWSIANVNQVLAKIYDWYRYSIAAGDGGGGLCVCNLYVHTFSLFEPSTQISPPINCFGWSWILDMDIAAKKCKMHFICQKKTTLPNSKNSRFTFKPLGSAEAEVTNTGCLLISRGWGSVKQSPGGVSTCFYYGKRPNIKSRNRGTLDRVELWLELLCWPLALLLLRIATLRCLVDFPGWEK